MINKSSNSNTELVRLVTAGSVDDGKSTLIGRLLYECDAIYDDQLEAVKKTSELMSKSEIDLSLVTDGLSAEREQKITIDVAYRHFSMPKRRFIIADVPGHEQYTRNMATGASDADLALLLVDARKGLMGQSKRHLFIANLLGISHIVVAVNKMDLVDYNQKVFEKIKKDFIKYASKLSIGNLDFIPNSALKGDMVVRRKANMQWYKGDTLLHYLKNIPLISNRNLVDFRFPIQLVIRPSQDFRGYAGKIESGIINKGDEVMLLPSGESTRIHSVVIDKKQEDYAFNPQSVILILESELDISRGEMIVGVNNVPKVSDEFEAMICWLSNKPLEKDKSYFIKHTTKVTRCFFDALHYKINIDNLHREKVEVFKLNDIGRVHLKTNEQLIFDSYSKNRNTGNFIIIDELTNNTIGAGVILNDVDREADKPDKNKI